MKGNYTLLLKYVNTGIVFAQGKRIGKSRANASDSMNLCYN
jgi:hypothetical protein